MRITFKRIDNEYIVTIDGRYYSFGTCKEALDFIFIRRELA